MITETYFGKRENLDMSDKQALLRSLVYMFDKTEAKHGCILTPLHIEEIKRALDCFCAEIEDKDFYIRVIGDNNRIADIFPFEYFENIGVSIQKTFQGYRFDYLVIIDKERACGVKEKVVAECFRRFEYLI